MQLTSLRNIKEETMKETIFLAKVKGQTDENKKKNEKIKKIKED